VLGAGVLDGKAKLLKERRKFALVFLVGEKGVVVRALTGFDLLCSD
jgi:hypothetical protein